MIYIYELVEFSCGWNMYLFYFWYGVVVGLNKIVGGCFEVGEFLVCLVLM